MTSVCDPDSGGLCASVIVCHGESSRLLLFIDYTRITVCIVRNLYLTLLVRLRELRLREQAVVAKDLGHGQGYAYMHTLTSNPPITH